jgi:hypothetical protein
MIEFVNTKVLDDALQSMYGHTDWEFVSENKDEFVVKFYKKERKS